jgi:putative restriction endonuclease
LARALPIEPLRAFEAKTCNLPRATEAEKLVIQRVGQDVFREALLTYWDGRCAVTGIAHPRLLRASHIKPWSRCETDAERLDVYNGLLLAAHLDAAFDAGLISFNDKGEILFSSKFAKDDRDALGIHDRLALRNVGSRHLENLSWHRSFLFGL